VAEKRLQVWGLVELAGLPVLDSQLGEFAFDMFGLDSALLDGPEELWFGHLRCEGLA
jgi:hypothetical protein